MELLRVLILSLMIFFSYGKKRKKPLRYIDENVEDYDADVFCKSQSRLIKMEKYDEIIIVDTFLGNSILLECKYWY